MAEVNLDSIKTNNSDAARRQERTAPPVEENTPPMVRESKPGFVGRMFGRVRIAENFEGAGQTVLEEVIIPALIDGIRDAIYTATDYILYGGSQRRNRNNKRSGGSYTPYSKKSQQRSGSARRTAPSSSAYYFTYDERSDADKDLEKMRDVIDQVEFVTIMDMFSIAKRQTNNYTYNDWGWYDLRSAMVRRTTDGRFYIDLPKPVPIEE